MKLLLENPEFRRLARSKLRPRMLVLLSAGAVLFLGATLIVMYWIDHSNMGPVASSPILRRFFFYVAGLQLSMISLYGLFLSAQSITQERERHTFEFQRLVAMGPRMLAIGKLLGAPCEAWWLVLVGTAAAFISVLAGAISPVEFLQVQLVVYVYGIVISSLGLMCSSAFEKTSRVTGLVVLMGIFSYNLIDLSGILRSRVSVWSCLDPRWVIMYVRESRVNTTSNPTFSFFGLDLPIFPGFVILNLGLAVLFLAVTIRRLTDEEFSFLSPRHALAAFGCVLFLMIGDFSGNDKFPSITDLTYFHSLCMGLLLVLAFALTPSAELLRCRCHRAARDLHWRIVFEAPNRLQDSTACFPMLVCVGLYALTALLLTSCVDSLHSSTVAVILMVGGMGLAMTALLLYIQAYSERSGYRAGIGLLFVVLIVPPMLVGFLTQESRNLAFVSPFGYLTAFDERFVGDSYYFHRPMRLPMGEAPGIGVVWTFPLICTALAVLLTVLAAMRIRFLLDLCDFERRREKENAEKPTEQDTDRKKNIAKALAALKEQGVPPAPGSAPTVAPDTSAGGGAG